MVASNGFKGDSGNTNIGLYVTVSMKSETGRPNDYWVESSLFFDKLKLTESGQKALERTARKINPKKINSGKYSVIVENRVAGKPSYPPLHALLRDPACTKSNHSLSVKRTSLLLQHC